MEGEKKISKFSSGLNIIMRLDFLWKNCQSFKRNGQYSKWNDELDTIWLELARDIKEGDYSDSKNSKGDIILGYNSRFKEFDAELRKYMPFISNVSGFTPIKSESVKNVNMQYEILMKKQLFLARLENELDKGTTYEEEDDDF